MYTSFGTPVYIYLKVSLVWLAADAHCSGEMCFYLSKAEKTGKESAVRHRLSYRKRGRKGDEILHPDVLKADGP